MFRWLGNKMRLAAAEGIRGDIERFTISLRGMPANERRTLVYLTQVVRLALVQQHRACALAFQGVMGAPMATAITELTAAHGIYVKQNAPHSAGAALLKLSLLSMCHPELRHSSQKMWHLLSGFTVEDYSQAEEDIRLMFPMNRILVTFEDFCYVPEPCRLEQATQ